MIDVWVAILIFLISFLLLFKKIQEKYNRFVKKEMSLKNGLKKSLSTKICVAGPMLHDTLRRRNSKFSFAVFGELFISFSKNYHSGDTKRKLDMGKNAKIAYLK